LILPDVNVLLYAFRPDLPQHLPHKTWLEQALSGEEPYGMSPQVLASVIRITTRPKTFALPTSLTSALNVASALLRHPRCQIVEPGPRHWDIFTRLCQSANATGNLVQDAWFAALAIESGCEWITTDRDYARFPGLRWRPPLAS
jgi:toxin-antitoxin system PIN domain toxin